MTASIDNFSKHIMSVCPQLTPVEMEIAVRDAAKHFCEEARVYQREIGRLDLKRGVSEYELDGEMLPSDLRESSGRAMMDVIEIKAMRNTEGLKMIGKSFDEMDSLMRGRWYALRGQTLEDHEKCEETPTIYVPTGRNKFIVYAQPKEGDYLTNILVALRPAEGTRVFPDDFFDEYYQVIVSGALIGLCSQSKKPYFQPDVVQEHRGKYNSLRGKYKRLGRTRFFGGSLEADFSRSTFIGRR